MPAWTWPAILYAFILAVHLAVPGRWVTGYVTDEKTGRPLGYRLNGLPVLALTVAAWAAACASGALAWDAFYLHRWEMAAGACALGLAFTLAIVLPAAPVPGQNLAQALYLGRLANPQWGQGRLDAKMYLYLAGAVLLELNVLSFTAHHMLLFGAAANPGVFVYAGLLSFFVCEYLNFEEVHLYTYDFMAERVGFKLGWGCLVFYPFFYCVGLWTTAELGDPDLPGWLLAVFALVFFSGWVLARGANLQKFQFKQNPDRPAFGFLDQGKLSDGTRNVMTGGFWGLSRHVNYLGEILMASGLALVLGHPAVPGPWLYPLYYVALLVPRQADDDRRCAERYGELWQEYCRRVPWRIIPWVY
jgi:protein-S-isoprenylcysteine O-methyltransferase Ste14